MFSRKITKEDKPLFIKFGTLIVCLALGLTSCSAKPTPDPAVAIRQAVVATLEAIPTTTPVSTPTPQPTTTPVSINDLFCEYNFCIGHPQDLYLMDQGSTRQPPIASTYGTGIVFGYSSNLFIEVAWTNSGTAFDALTAMHTILQGSESLQGTLDHQTVGNLTVYYQPSTTASGLLPYGEVAVWQCGDRDFAWKVYTPEDGMAKDLLKQSLENFKCQSY